MISSIRAEHGQITYSDHDGDETITIDEARDLITELATAIAEAERQKAEVVAACADGHEYGAPFNSWGHDRTDWTQVTVRNCQRPGCDGREDLPGWMMFAGRLHIQPHTNIRIDCTGPGCETCDMEALGRTIREFLADGLAHLDAAIK